MLPHNKRGLHLRYNFLTDRFAAMDNVKAYLYDAKGSDCEMKILDVDVSALNEHQILWIVITKRDLEVISSVTEHVGIMDAPCGLMVKEDAEPRLGKYNDFFHFSINAVSSGKHGSPQSLKVDFIVGRNYVLTVSTGEPEYFREFREREKGESMIGELDAESIVASLLDRNIVEYFRSLNGLETRIDSIDEHVLKSELGTDKFLQKMVQLRSDASKLRRWLMPHREVYYALARPDFQQIADSTAAEHYRLLSQHFENAVDAVEHARETVVSVFELYATKSTHMTNMLIQRLTFLTLITGAVAVVAGILGMNFEAEIFKIEWGFAITVGGLLLLGIVLTIFARVRGWI